MRQTTSARTDCGGIPIRLRSVADHMIRLHESGIAAPSYTTLNGEYCLRAALSNHRTRLEDLTMAVVGVATGCHKIPVG